MIKNIVDLIAALKKNHCIVSCDELCDLNDNPK